MNNMSGFNFGYNQQPVVPQSYNTMMQQRYMQPQMAADAMMISGASRPVSSKEEAQAVAMDFGGGLMIFPDFSHGRIHIKQWDKQRGQATFASFVPEQPEPEPAQVEYVSEERFNATIKELRDMIAAKGKRKGAAADVQPDESSE